MTRSRKRLDLGRTLDVLRLRSYVDPDRIGQDGEHWRRDRYDGGLPVVGLEYVEGGRIVWRQWMTKVDLETAKPILRAALDEWRAA